MAAAGAAAASPVGGVFASSRPAASPVRKRPETLVRVLYDTLDAKQRKLICMPYAHPSRTVVQANWAIVEPAIAELLRPEQQELVREIVRGVTSEEFYPRFLAQMQTDGGGLQNYHAAVFGNPDSGKFEWVMTGRHVTMRADGHSDGNAAFGGPIFYGHAPKFNEDPGHPGNVFWYQGQQANAVYHALDADQRKEALFNQAPDEAAIQFRGKAYPGIAVSELSSDQKELVWRVMHDILAPYRASDVRDVMHDIAANGGLDRVHLSFYRQDALANDGTWDIWRLEGPAFVWHFRGAPHVHTWVHVASRAEV